MSNCAFDINKRDCAVLNKKQCVGCHFKKTKEELEAGREKARKILAQKYTPDQSRSFLKYRGI